MLTVIHKKFAFIIMMLLGICYSLALKQSLPFPSHIFFLPRFYLVIPSNTIYEVSPLFNAS